MTIIKEISIGESVATTDTGTIEEGTTMGDSKEVSEEITEKIGSRDSPESTDRDNSLSLSLSRAQAITPTTTTRKQIIDSL